MSFAIEPLRFRQALGHFASGVTVITSHQQGTPIGFTCGSFYSVSVAPPLVSFSVMKESASYPAIRASGRFAVNILSGAQSALSTQFAKRGADKFQGVAYHTSPLGNPLLDNCLQWLDCEIYAEHQAGDHFIVIGHVKALSQAELAEPLVYFKGQYRELGANGA